MVEVSETDGAIVLKLVSELSGLYCLLVEDLTELNRGLHCNVGHEQGGGRKGFS